LRYVQSLLFAALFIGTIAHAAAISFPECPAAGKDTTGCELLITVTAVSGGGAATAFTVAASSPDLGPYDGADDTLIGILNNSGASLTSISLSSNTDLFGFDGDGICAYIACPGTPDLSGYGPAGVTFSGINASATTSGTVNFNPGIADGGSAFFSLEGPLSPSQIMQGTPEPSTRILFGIGVAGLGLFLRRTRA
jgi:hypothetical protein